MKGATSVNEEPVKENKEHGQVSMDLNGDDENVGANFKSNEDDLVDVMIQTQWQGLDMPFLRPDMSGPNNVKAEGTWTRINRMDFGLGGFSKAIMLPRLGKRDSREAHEGQVDEQNCKKGKLNSDEESNDHGSAGVESHPCQGQ